jgi:magnesium-transporting ATPase (P-type)
MTMPDLASSTAVASSPRARTAADVAQSLAVDPARGLVADDVRRRLEEHGPNQLAGTKQESGFQAFVRQYQDFMQVVLLVAAASLLRAGEFAAGSMGPKVEAAARFVERTGMRAAIGSLEHIEEIVAGKADTQVVAA